MHLIKVLCTIAPYEYADFDQFIQSQKDKEGLSTVVILDGLEDPHNLGSILRTADASGVDGVIIPKRRSVALTQTVAKHQQVRYNMFQLCVLRI